MSDRVPLERFDRPVVLVTDYPHTAQGGGAVILRDLLRTFPRDQIIWVSLSPSREGHDHSWNGLTVGLREAGRSVWLDSTIRSDTLTRDVAHIIQENNAGAAWIVLHGVAVHVAARLKCYSSVPIHATVHDDPAYANALRSKRYFALVPWIAREFRVALANASSVDVISQPMADLYRKKYHIASSVVHRPIENLIQERRPRDPALGLCVGVLGSTYSYGQLPVLARAVSTAANQMEIPGRVIVMGRSHGERLRDECQSLPNLTIEVTGHLDEAQSIEKLTSCFALYLNYPFGIRDRMLRRTSFPTKLSTYIQAARPLMIHAPRDSSVSQLPEFVGYAASWESMNPSDGARIMQEMWREPQSHQSQHASAERVRRRYYDPEHNRKRLHALLDRLVLRSSEMAMA